MFLGFLMATWTETAHGTHKPSCFRAGSILILGVGPFSVPTLVTISRARRGLLPFATPGKDHAAHRLVQSGARPSRGSANALSARCDWREAQPCWSAIFPTEEHYRWRPHFGIISLVSCTWSAAVRAPSPKPSSAAVIKPIVWTIHLLRYLKPLEVCRHGGFAILTGRSLTYSPRARGRWDAASFHRDIHSELILQGTAPLGTQKPWGHGKSAQAMRGEREVIVVGGSAAGLFTAASVARGGRRVRVLESKPQSNRTAHSLSPINSATRWEIGTREYRQRNSAVELFTDGARRSRDERTHY